VDYLQREARVKTRRSIYTSQVVIWLMIRQRLQARGTLATSVDALLRSLKRTVQLHHIAARNESMMEKELVSAISAYNLVRAVMALAARRHNLVPRQLSFTFVLNMVNAHWHRLQAATTKDAYQSEVFGLLDAAAEGVHPKRKSADRSRELPGAAVTVFPLARNPNELFKWHWAMRLPTAFVPQEVVPAAGYPQRRSSFTHPFRNSGCKWRAYRFSVTLREMDASQATSISR